jgi:hypothetical protein
MSYNAIQITQINNGYILEWEEELDEGFAQGLHVIEEHDTELKAMQELLWFIQEFFGVFHSKHNKENLYIEIRKKDDYGIEEWKEIKGSLPIREGPPVALETPVEG